MEYLKPPRSSLIMYIFSYDTCEYKFKLITTIVIELQSMEESRDCY